MKDQYEEPNLSSRCECDNIQGDNYFSILVASLLMTIKYGDLGSSRRREEATMLSFPNPSFKIGIKYLLVQLIL